MRLARVAPEAQRQVKEDSREVFGSHLEDERCSSLVDGVLYRCSHELTGDPLSAEVGMNCQIAQ